MRILLGYIVMAGAGFWLGWALAMRALRERVDEFVGEHSRESDAEMYERYADDDNPPGSL